MDKFEKIILIVILAVSFIQVIIFFFTDNLVNWVKAIIMLIVFYWSMLTYEIREWEDVQTK